MSSIEIICPKCDTQASPVKGTSFMVWECPECGYTGDATEFNSQSHAHGPDTSDPLVEFFMFETAEA